MSETPLPLVSPLQPPPAVRKKPWQSKALWANLVIASLMMYPPTGAFVSQYPIAVTLGVTLLNMLLRFITHGKISLED